MQEYRLVFVSTNLLIDAYTPVGNILAAYIYICTCTVVFLLSHTPARARKRESIRSDKHLLLQIVVYIQSCHSNDCSIMSLLSRRSHSRATRMSMTSILMTLVVTPGASDLGRVLEIFNSSWETPSCKTRCERSAKLFVEIIASFLNREEDVRS